MWWPSTKWVLVQPGKRQPLSLERRARLIDGGMERDFRDMDRGWVVWSSVMLMIVQSQVRRRDVSAETWGPDSRCGWIGFGGGADVSAETS